MRIRQQQRTEQQKHHVQEQQQIRENRGTACEAMKGKEKGKRKRKIQQYLTPRPRTLNAFVMRKISD